MISIITHKKRGYKNTLYQLVGSNVCGSYASFSLASMLSKNLFNNSVKSVSFSLNCFIASLASVVK